MINKQDIRYSILLKLKNEAKATAEFIANEYLYTLHSDLGTIRRALVDLVESGYIKESNVDWQSERDTKSIIFNIDTKGPPNRKNSNRLLNSEDIKAIRIYLTLEGCKFLIESENVKYISWTIRNEWWMKIVYIIIGATMTYFGYKLRDIKIKKDNKLTEKNIQIINENNIDQKKISNSSIPDTSKILDTIPKN